MRKTIKFPRTYILKITRNDGSEKGDGSDRDKNCHGPLGAARSAKPLREASSKFRHGKMSVSITPSKF